MLGNDIRTNLPPTDKQMAYLNSLRVQQGLSPVTGQGNTKRGVSQAINDHLITIRMEREQGLTSRRPSVPAVTTPRPAPSNTPDIPAGFYAVPSATGTNDLDFWQVDRPTEGTWAGWTFVKRCLGGGDGGQLKRIRVTRTEQSAALTVLAGTDLEAARILFGQQIGRCGDCGRSLTDELSRARGIGPDCWDRKH